MLGWLGICMKVDSLKEMIEVGESSHFVGEKPRYIRTWVVC
jgi:hypothetical protein